MLILSPCFYPLLIDVDCSIMFPLFLKKMLYPHWVKHFTHIGDWKYIPNFNNIIHWWKNIHIIHLYSQLISQIIHIIQLVIKIQPIIWLSIGDVYQLLSITHRVHIIQLNGDILYRFLDWRLSIILSHCYNINFRLHHYQWDNQWIIYPLLIIN